MKLNMSRSEKRKKFRKIRNRVFFLLLGMLSLAVIVYSAWNLLGYYGDYRGEVALEEQLADLRADSGVEMLPEKSAGGKGGTVEISEKSTEQMRSFYNKMKQKNEDYVCWITVDGTGIDYPVVKRDNVFYLNHDINGEKNRHGSIFLDETCSPGDGVLLLHGHHMKDGTMFGELKKYKDNDFCEKNRTIFLELEEETAEYRIFAAAQIDLTTEGTFAFEMLPKTAEELSLYIEGLNRASFWYDERVVGDEIENGSYIVLSTCDYGTDEQRLLVAAKKIE